MTALRLTLVLTHDCNLGCRYCYTGRKFRRAMAPSVVAKALDLARAAGPTKLAYFGGEPLLEWDLLEDTARQVSAHGLALEQSVTTNGTLLDRGKALRLGELGVYVALSIDGTRAAHEANRPTMGGRSSWDAVSAALDLLVAAGRAFETISVVTPASARELGASVRELLSRGVPRVSLNPCFDAVWTDDDLAAFRAGLEEAAGAYVACMRAGRVVGMGAIESKIAARLKGGLTCADKCSLGEESVAVAPSGNLYFCERAVGEDDDLRHVIGHVDTGVDPAKVAALRARMPQRHAANDECAGCAARPYCSAGCACANLAETGDLARAGGVQCWYERTTLELAEAAAALLAAERNDPFLSWFGLAPHAIARARRSLPVVG